MRFTLLGPIGVELTGGIFKGITGKRQQALLASLLIKACQPVSVSELCRELWGESPPMTAKNSLQVHVSRLRRQLQTLANPPQSAPRIRYWSEAYSIVISFEDLDVHIFRQYIHQAHVAMSDDREASRQLLGEALLLWKGPPLGAAAPAGPLCASSAAQLNEEYLAALETKLSLDILCAGPTAALGELRRVSSLHPWHESITALLMTALYLSGRQAEALKVYYEARKRLNEDLGLVPSDQLECRFRDILRGRVSLTALSPIPLRPSTRNHSSEEHSSGFESHKTNE
ncbi:BTAD domain-containing putative transcriptional regulator [Streptomyces sp. V4I8]|uniref:AfsR/SARP family transcriptional regulator n=1 Tax=Streptomyces sp. V4I8 TaxID=3156469 RepID=UPI003511FF97